MLQRSVDTRHASNLRRLIVPVVLTVTVLCAAAVTVSTSAGCGKDKPGVDASLGDGGPDTPIV